MKDTYDVLKTIEKEWKSLAFSLSGSGVHFSRLPAIPIILKDECDNVYNIETILS